MMLQLSYEHKGSVNVQVEKIQGIIKRTFEKLCYAVNCQNNYGQISGLAKRSDDLGRISD